MVFKYTILILLLYPSIVVAKCATEYRTISGNLTSGDMPLADAKLTFEFHNGSNELISNSVATDESGNYSLEIKYNEYSGRGIFFADKCNFSLEELQLKIEAKDHVFFKDSIAISNEITTYNKAFKVIDTANRDTR